jgi:tetratricopeptide (TPR) repeat protein
LLDKALGCCAIYQDLHHPVNAYTMILLPPPTPFVQRSPVHGTFGLAGGPHPAVLGLLIGASITSFAEVLSAEPGAMAWAVALPLFGSAMAAALRSRLPGWGRGALCLAGALFLASPGLGAELVASLSLAMQLSPSQGLLLFMGTWLAASSLCFLPLRPPPALGPLTIVPGLLGLSAGFLLPAWASLLLVVLFVAASLRWENAPAPADRADSLSPTLALVAVALLGAWSTAHLWTAVRAWLDPTPFGWLAVLVASGLGLLLGWALASLRRARLGLEPLLASAAMAWTMAALPALAPEAAARLPALLVSYDPGWLLPSLLAVPGLFTALLLGLACPPPALNRIAAWPSSLALGAGVILGVQGGPLGSTLLPLAAVIGGAVLVLVARAPVRRISGLLGAGALCVLWWLLPPLQVSPLTVGWATSIRDDASLERHIAALAKSDWTLATWGPEGSAGLRWIDETMVADVDGTPIWSVGRDRAAVRQGAQLVPLLSDTPERLLVLGDDLGWAQAIMLTHEPSSITASVAQPALLRAVVAEDEDLRRRLLAPQVQHQAVPGAWLLRQSRPFDGILQLATRPWADAGGGPLALGAFRLAADRLTPGGVYVAVLATSRLPMGELAATLQDFSRAFPGGMACLPVQGADHLLLVGRASDAPPPLARFLERSHGHPNALRSLALDSGLDLADRCVFTASALDTWGKGRAARRFPPLSLPSSLTQQPLVHLADLDVPLADAGALWDTSDASAEAAELGARHDAIEHFLALLGETRSGDLEALFQQAEALRNSAEGSRELDTLIAPHLARARNHMDQARRGGIQHSGWQQAKNELTLARMLHPQATEPIFLEAMIHEARGEQAQAERLYEAVIEHQEDHLEALFGLARIQIAQGRDDAAESTLVEAIRHHPRNAAAHQVLGVALMRAGRLGDAETSLRKAAALAGPDHVQPQAALTELFLAMEQPSMAIAHAERCIMLEPSAYHYTLLGRCHLDLGRPIPAERAFHQAVLQNAGFYPPRAGLAQIFAERGDYEQAADQLRAVLAADPGNPAALANLQEIQRLLDVEQDDPRVSVSPNGQP